MRFQDSGRSLKTGAGACTRGGGGAEGEGGGEGGERVGPWGSLGLGTRKLKAQTLNPKP